jgi:hypothetical protein
MRPKVFISHSTKDKALADAICQRLESEGVKCWIAPRDIEVGSDWTEGIMRGIETCRVFVLVFSGNANGSEHVRREVAKAFSLKLAVIPFRIEAVMPNRSLGYFLETVQWLNAMDPPSIADDPGVVCWQMNYALADRNWQLAKGLLEKMKQSEDNQFAYAGVAVPVGCYAILLARLEGEEPGTDPNFARTREQLDQKVQKPPGNAQLLSSLGVVDALLGHKEASISEAERAVEMLPISKDALIGSGIVTNLAVVYAWNDELDQAFATLDPLKNIPYGIYYGQLKLDPYWEPLRKDS